MVKKIAKNPISMKQLKFNIDLGVTIEDGLVNAQEIVDYLKGSMKINNLKGNLGSDITVVQKGNQNIIITSRLCLAKRYVKYLLKKVLKRMGILEFLKINATEKNTYKIKYLKAEVKSKE
jgi:large subunit ribosomal protein L22e